MAAYWRESGDGAAARATARGSFELMPAGREVEYGHDALGSGGVGYAAAAA